ncbi:CIC11C00000005250 [Sungouiella intermedia]|uniref:CIC11C00000005250 n=1 Tax=Sungouiella intermedia TaxID=45354 RepID=A0A1L0D4W6_9ASCO|nr:CIC11C00000005250 [[Candida] intermedia]
MGCAGSTMASDADQLYLSQKLVSNAIDRTLIQKKKKEQKEMRLFLLGAGESGKSTVLKQMRLMHKHSFTDFERRQYTEVIWFDLIESMKVLIFNARKLGIPLDCDQPNLSLVKFKRIIMQTKGIEDCQPGEMSLIGDYYVGYDLKRGPIDPEMTLLLSCEFNDKSEVCVEGQAKKFSRAEQAEAISMLWTKDSGIKKCYQQSNNFQLELSVSYYFDNVHKFKNPMYRSSDQDIIMGRIKTTGITESTFEINNTTLKVLDAGGQRSERKKWIHCFENIDAIIFVLAVLEYDQMLYEDGRVHRMNESFQLFEAICNSTWFQNTPFILFLNKVDLLEKKLPLSPIAQYFPDYKLDPLDVNSVLDYFESRLLGLNRTQKPIYIHRTCATDTKSMSFVLTAVTDMIIQQSLKRSGII